MFTFDIFKRKDQDNAVLFNKTLQQSKLEEQYSL